MFSTTPKRRRWKGRPVLGELREDILPIGKPGHERAAQLELGEQAVPLRFDFEPDARHYFMESGI